VKGSGLNLYCTFAVNSIRSDTRPTNVRSRAQSGVLNDFLHKSATRIGRHSEQ
jgi:hypothetical protein